MRVFWSGSISFGLVNIPIKMFTATRDHDLHFNQLHRDDSGRIRYRVACEACGKEVTRDELMKGYEYGTGRFVTFEEEELEGLAIEASRTVDILDFVPLSEVDPLNFQRGYYLAPQKGAAKAYHLLREALTRTGRVAVATFVLKRKGHLALVRPAPGILVLQTIFYSDEVAPASEVPVPPAEPTDRELDLARSLIESLSVPFQANRYQDVYRSRLEEAVARKVEGKQIVAPPARERAEIVDLMTALEQSLARTRKGREFESAMPERRGSKRKRTETQGGS